MVIQSIKEGYDILLDNNVSRETARMILPESTTTVMNLNGDVRTWISFLSQRLHKTAQKEIRMVAEEVRDIFMQELPIVSKALFDFENAYEISVFDRLVIEKYVKKGVINYTEK
jgi:thymidylate synthase ThyX